MNGLGVLQEVPDLRTVWPHEALDFTPWLAREENISLLSAAVEMDLEIEESEAAVGDFKADIVASEAGTKRKVIIENQLEDTNHDHLGKLITYASGRGAEVIIWLVKHAREEHKAAIEWLNNHTDEDVGFFLLEIKLYRIDNSAPAVKFEVVERPNNWQKVVRSADAEKPRHKMRLMYWTAFNDFAFPDSIFAKHFSRRKPNTDNWMDLSIGSSACHIVIDIVQKTGVLRVGLYIPDDKALFASLLENRDEVEAALGFPLEWRELPEKKASRICIERNVDFSAQDEWETQFKWIASTAVKLKSAFKKYL